MEFRDDLDWIRYRPVGFNQHAGPFFIAHVEGPAYYMHLHIKPHHLNQGGVVHGGVSMTLADNAMGVAAWHAAGERPTATIEFGMKFIAAGKAGGPLYGRAEIERRTKDLCFLSGELWSHGRKIATASGVWKYIDPPNGWGRGAPST